MYRDISCSGGSLYLTQRAMSYHRFYGKSQMSEESNMHFLFKEDWKKDWNAVHVLFVCFMVLIYYWEKDYMVFYLLGI